MDSQSADTLEALAARHGFSTDVARKLREALLRGHGSMAQFNDPALGGMGQWHRGGMLMIGDLFNDDLKARVGAFLRELSEHLPQDTLTDDAAPRSGSIGSSSEWPAAFGAPSSSGSQNGARYAFFREAHRLVIVGGASAGTYDTGDHVISGVSQQQGGTSDLAFTSQHGPVRLSDLQRTETPKSSARNPESETHPPRAGAPAASGDRHTASSSSSHASAMGAAPSANHRDDFATLERLAELHRKQVLTDDEYRAKKTEILARF